MSANYLQNTNADWIGKEKSIEEILTGKIIRIYRLRTMVRQIIGVLSGTHQKHKQSGNKKCYFNLLRNKTAKTNTEFQLTGSQWAVCNSKQRSSSKLCIFLSKETMVGFGSKSNW